MSYEQIRAAMAMAPKPTKDSWVAARKAIFKKVKVRTASCVKTMTRLDAYLQHLTSSARNGDRAAKTEATRLMKLLDTRGILAEAKPVVEESPAMKKSIAEQEAISRIGTKYSTLNFCAMYHEIRGRYAEKFGNVSQDKVFDIIDLDPKLVKRFIAIIKQNRRKNGNGAVESTVGYGKPPVDGRWAAGQSGNPSGSRRRRDDAWESFRAGLAKSVDIVNDGHSIKMDTAEVIVARLFEDACKGNRNARAELRNLLMHLNDRGLLKPPEVEKRQRRKSVGIMTEETSQLEDCVMLVTACWVREELTEYMNKAFGVLEDFETNWEISLRRKIALNPCAKAIELGLV